jgi:hypothetical protein
MSRDRRGELVGVAQPRSPVQNPGSTGIALRSLDAPPVGVGNGPHSTRDVLDCKFMELG